MAKKNGGHTKVEVPEIEIVNFDLTLVGDSPLICHAFSEKAKKQIIEKQMKKAKQAKEPKVPARDFVNSLYWLTEKPELPDDPDEAYETAMEAVNNGAEFGFKAVAFKSSAVGGCRWVDGTAMTEARGSFHVNGEFVTIEGPAPVMREDTVVIGRGTTDIRYRGEFQDWKATLNISLNRRAMSIGQVVNLFNLGGFGVGVGDWRPQKDGSYGRYHVANEPEIAA